MDQDFEKQCDNDQFLNFLKDIEKAIKLIIAKFMYSIRFSLHVMNDLIKVRKEVH